MYAYVLSVNARVIIQMLIDHYKQIIYVQKLVLDVFVLDLKLVLASISIFRPSKVNSKFDKCNQTNDNTSRLQLSIKSLKISILGFKSCLHPPDLPIIWIISAYLFTFTSVNRSHNSAGTVFLVSISCPRDCQSVPLNLSSCMV